MRRISIGTIYGKVAEHRPRRIALISQRLNPREEYEDGDKVIRLALRNRESAFAAKLGADGIQHETFAAGDLATRVQDIVKGGFGLCVVAGEVCSQSISIANSVRQAGFRAPVYLEITEEEAEKKTSVEAAYRNAVRLGATDLLEHFVYLTKTVRSPSVIEFVDLSQTDSQDINADFTVALMDAYRRAHTEAGYNAANFLSLLGERGGRETAVYLVHQPDPSLGFTRLWERRRLDLTVEAIILRPEWWTLFSDDDRTAAFNRLSEYRFTFPEDSWSPNRDRVERSVPAPLVIAPATPPTRTEIRVSRIDRDSEKVRSLKNLYQYCCQICGFRIDTRSGGFYVEVHHIHPLGGSNGGLDERENMLVLCPNHHALFDCGTVRFVSATAVEVDGVIHPLKAKHQIADASINYHNARCTGDPE